MEQERISVVIPVWNEKDRITRALISMQNQTWKNLEIIVVDDGSTDGTQDIVKEIAKEDSRISFYDNPHKVRRTNWRGYDINAGYAARNYGFSIAKGNWITTQDADDASLSNRIEVQYNLAKKYNATAVFIQWQHLRPELLGKKLDVERIFHEKGEDAVVMRPEELNKLPHARRGILMLEPIHRFIPFPIKWFPHTRKLFYRDTTPFPGADNCMFFNRSVVEAGILMRTRNARTWGVPSGRGSGRDFAYNITAKLKNTWSFKLPLYLWNANTENPEFTGYEKYLI
ncbi:MAG: glycosyltransferase family 2 protein [Candidatus Adlerbacteria bacterium]|nr:glycosyltransferase family 2 protein [Candidatus Adlerbacteria bacterium]